MPLTYDPTGLEPANFIEGEVHVLDYTPDTPGFPGTGGTLQISPIEETAFYKEGFVARGYNDAYPGGVELVPYKDYRYSPMYLTYSQATGKEIFSYIVMQHDEYDSVEIDYHGVGGTVDATLLMEIFTEQNENPFNKLNPANWQRFRGQMKTLNISLLAPQPAPQTFLEVLAGKMAEIKDAIENLPSAPVVSLPPYLVENYNTLVGDVNGKMLEVTNSLGILSQYGVHVPKLKFIDTTTYDVVDADIGSTLVFTHASGCTLTLYNGLIENMWFRVCRFTGAGNVTFTGPAMRLATYTINGTQFEGEMCYFNMLQKAVEEEENDIYLLDSNRFNSEALMIRAEINTIATIDVTAAKDKYTFVNNRVEGCEVSFDKDLLPGTYFTFIQGVSGGAIDLTDTVDPGDWTIIPLDGVTKTSRPGHVIQAYVLAGDGTTDTGHPVIATWSNAPVKESVVITDNNLTITNAHIGKMIICQHAVGTTITLNSGLVAGYHFSLLQDTGAGPITMAGTAATLTAIGTIATAGAGQSLHFRKIVEAVVTPTPAPDKYLVTKDWVNPGVTYASTTLLTETADAVTAELSRFSRIRQTVLRAPVNPATGLADYIYNVSGTTMKLKDAVVTDPLILSFADGFDAKGERNIIVEYGDGLDAGDQIGFGSGSYTANAAYLYLQYDNNTKVLSGGFSDSPPLYSLVRPTSANNNQYWYPTDHRSCGYVYNTGTNSWSPVLRIYVGETINSATPPLNIINYAIQGMAIVETNSRNWWDSGVSGGDKFMDRMYHNLGVDPSLIYSDAKYVITGAPTVAAANNLAIGDVLDVNVPLNVSSATFSSYIKSTFMELTAHVDNTVGDGFWIAFASTRNPGAGTTPGVVEQRYPGKFRFIVRRTF